MEETPEGLAVAAAVREAAKRKRAAEGSEDGSAPAAKRAGVNASVPPVKREIVHEVAVPEDFDESGVKHEPELHGKRNMLGARGAIHIVSRWPLLWRHALHTAHRSCYCRFSVSRLHTCTSARLYHTVLA